MKGLIKTVIIMAMLIFVGIGASAIVYTYLANRLATAHDNGLEEGYNQGYLEGLQEGNEAGYQEGSKIGYTKGNDGDYDISNEKGFYFVYNPTYDEVHKILAEREQALAEDKKDSAKEIHNYAEANGIRSGYVRALIARQARKGMVYLYELVAFETVDRGFIIIEPWSHTEVKIEVGKRYNELNGLPPRAYDDTITKITIVW
ncbi:hypothetical protein ACFLUR_00825 [Chloroflexota bacterium]